jgi:hypothetical protein
MASLKDAMQFDRSQLRPEPESAVKDVAGPQAIMPDVNIQMSPFMHCAMPLVASTYDSLQKQYYGSRVPQIRLLPIQGAQ